MNAFRPSRAPPRDTEASVFARILGDLVGRVAGALAAVLVDMDGETVDYAGYIDPFDAKVAAAHWAIVLREIGSIPRFGAAQFLVVRGAQRIFITQALPDGYALIVLLHRFATSGFAITSRAFDVCVRELKEEAGWSVDREERARWYAIDVLEDERRYPKLVRHARGEAIVEVLGTLVGMQDHDTGYRVRFVTGGEATIVRERGGAWYADERVYSRDVSKTP